MNERILIIPDIHGRTFWRNAVDGHPGIPTVFLGDYVDPYRDEGITNEDALANFKEIIAYAKVRDNVTLLLGNHDLHYLLPGTKFGRYCWRLCRAIQELTEDNMELFSLAHHIRNNDTDIVFSHAGILSSWLEYEGLLNMDAEGICNYLNDRRKDMGYLYHLAEEVSTYRGGWSGAPCPVWADVRDHFDERSPPEFFQIFGHTQLTEHIITDHWACLDCREAFFLKENSNIVKIKKERKK